MFYETNHALNNFRLIFAVRLFYGDRNFNGLYAAFAADGG